MPGNTDRYDTDVPDATRGDRCTPWMLMVRLPPAASTRIVPALAGSANVSGPAVVRRSPALPGATSDVSIFCQTPLASLKWSSPVLIRLWNPPFAVRYTVDVAFRSAGISPSDLTGSVAHDVMAGGGALPGGAPGGATGGGAGAWLCDAPALLATTNWLK